MLKRVCSPQINPKITLQPWSIIHFLAFFNIVPKQASVGVHGRLAVWREMPAFAPMFMKAKRRRTKGGEEYIYYILCGSWRDSQGLTMRDTRRDGHR